MAKYFFIFFTPSDTFQIISTSQNLTRKSMQCYFFSVPCEQLHITHCKYLACTIVWTERLQLFLHKKCFLPPCRNSLPWCYLPLVKRDTLLPAGHQPGEHPPPAWHSQYQADASNSAGNASHCCRSDVLDTPCTCQEINILKNSEVSKGHILD